MRGKWVRRALAVLLLALGVTVLTVVARGYGRDSVKVRLLSPDRKFVAEVRSKLTMDPPDEYLWIGADGQPALMVAHLCPDQDWCDEIAWSPDSSRVAFVITGVRVLVFDSRTMRVLVEKEMVPQDGYLGSLVEARSVRFSEDGLSLLFQKCPRDASGGCVWQQVPL